MSKQPPKADQPNNKTDGPPPKGYERTIANWTVVLGVSTLMLFVATGISAYFLYVTDHTLKETLVETGRAARAAEETVKVANDTARRQLRAYLAITGAGLDCPDCPIKKRTVYPPKNIDGDIFRMTLKIKNFGATPAYQVRSCRGTLVTGLDKFPPSDFPYSCAVACETCPPITVGPGADETVILGAENNEVVDAFLGRNRLFYFGIFQFRDTFGQKRELPFCWFFQGDADRRSWDLTGIGCPEHNSAVDD